MYLRGVLAPIPTPFDRNGQVDEARMRDMCARLADSPLLGLVVLGTTGEAMLLDEDESDRAIAAARAGWPSGPNGRRFMVGTGRESTAATIRATQRAADLGAEMVLVRTPGFYKSQMNTDVFVRHYTAVADASPVPVFLYNFTAVTGVNISSEAVETLAKHDNIYGIKESGGDVSQIETFVRWTPSDFRVFAGSSASFLAALRVGAEGGILALANLLPAKCQLLHDLAFVGKPGSGPCRTRCFRRQADCSMHGIAGLKAASQAPGCDVGDPPPLQPA
jgi:4-hydroxy-2-oxoglutarate aldolase